MELGFGWGLGLPPPVFQRNFPRKHEQKPNNGEIEKMRGKQSWEEKREEKGEEK